MNREPKKKKKSTAVVLIPKQLRMEWTDRLALDHELSHVAFRVACVIGYHFSRHRGDTFIAQETVAKIMVVSERTVWTAVMELERRGYLLIRRRELGVRTSDGRRVCGGRGVANVYLPAHESAQVTDSEMGRKLAARCDLLWNERSQNSARKVATDCDPTLTSPSEKNPCERAGPPDHTLGPPGDRLRARLGDDKFAAWFGGVTAERDGEVIRLFVPTKHRRMYLDTNFREQLEECWAAHRVEIVVRASPPAEPVAAPTPANERQPVGPIRWDQLPPHLRPGRPPPITLVSTAQTAGATAGARRARDPFATPSPPPGLDRHGQLVAVGDHG